jgi:hypothetical protein
MANESALDNSGVEQKELLNFEVLDKPEILVDGDMVLKVFAVSPVEDGTYIPVGYVSTKSTRVSMLGEFSGEPTGEYAPCNAVKGFVGEGAVYEKTVTTDTALSGFRTAIAQKRAAKAVKSRLS